MNSTLLLLIDSQVYTLENLRPDPDIARAAWRLLKLPGHNGGRKGGGPYEVSLTEWGVECTCPSWVYKMSATGSFCKHGKSLVEVGLIPKELPERSWP